MRTQKVYTVLRKDGTIAGRFSGSYVAGPTPKPYASRSPATAACAPGDVVVEHMLWHDLEEAAIEAYCAFYDAEADSWPGETAGERNRWRTAVAVLLRGS